MRSFSLIVTYAESSEILIDVSKLAEDYEDPHSLREK
jgi:hypothetical protein